MSAALCKAPEIAPAAPSDLAAALAAASEASELVAVLWSWLELRLNELGSRAAQIRADAVAQPPATVPEAKRLARLVTYAADPLVPAAHALAMLELAVMARGAAPELGGAAPVSGIDGQPRLVLVRSGFLVRGHDDRPPAAREQPSLYTLAPHLNVVPVILHGIAVRVLGPPEEGSASADWDDLQYRLAVIRGDPLAGFEAVLATLGDAGVKWDEPSHPTSRGSMAVETMTATDEDRAKAAIQGAADLAGDKTLLLLPELCATPGMLLTLRTALEDLASLRRGPALTVVGLRHRFIGEEEQRGAADEPRWVNEAVLLGPKGHELLRHRKLTAASSGGLSEDIVVGSEIAVILTPIGGIAILTCLDLFAERVDPRTLVQPASLLCVPSFSDHVSPHRAAAVRLANRAWGLVLVCNRGLGGRWAEDDVRSFAAVAFENQPLTLRPEGTAFVYA